MTEYGMKKGTSLKITIHPPFYWSTASKLLYFCIGLHSFRIRHPLHHQTDREETYG